MPIRKMSRKNSKALLLIGPPFYFSTTIVVSGKCDFRPVGKRPVFNSGN